MTITPPKFRSLIENFNFNDVYRISLLVRKRECFPIPNTMRPGHKMSHKKEELTQNVPYYTYMNYVQCSLFVPKCSQTGVGESNTKRRTFIWMLAARVRRDIFWDI